MARVLLLGKDFRETVKAKDQTKERKAARTTSRSGYVHANICLCMPILKDIVKRFFKSSTISIISHYVTHVCLCTSIFGLITQHHLLRHNSHHAVSPWQGKAKTAEEVELEDFHKKVDASFP